MYITYQLKLICLFVLLSVSSSIQADAPVSGYEFITQSTKEMQDDEFANPGMVTVFEGEQHFNTPGTNSKSCSSCHGESGEKLNIKRIAQYPIYSDDLERPISLQDQVHLCWQDQLENEPLIYDDVKSVALETYVRYLARGEVVNVEISGVMKKYYDEGEILYNTRFGQLDMACVHCHVYHQGARMRGQVLSQGQSNGFPEYRLGSGKITSLHRRLTECFVSFRAIPFDLGSEELINLEIFVNAKGNGLKIETPAVRY